MRRAKSIAALGFVKREKDLFRVTTSSLKSSRISYKVWRVKAGKVRCNCSNFVEEVERDSQFLCEHILAVKYALIEKNTEHLTKLPIKIKTKIKVNSQKLNSNVKTVTEPHKSKSGEQKPDKTRKSNPINGQFGKKKIPGMNQLAYKKGEIKMKQEVLLTESKELEYIEANSGNVLGFPSKLRRLKKEVNPNLIKSREGWRDRNGNPHMVDYVEWHTVADILDEITPNWTHAVKDIRQFGNIITVTVAITIDGVTREGIGTGIATNEMGIKKAEHDALKRASVKFGIARELYKKENKTTEFNSTISFQKNGFPLNPIATSLSDLVTAKQLGMIRIIAKEIGIKADEECEKKMSCSTDELSKKAASSLITHLQNIQRKQQTQVPMLSVG